MKTSGFVAGRFPRMEMFLDEKRRGRLSSRRYAADRRRPCDCRFRERCSQTFRPKADDIIHVRGEAIVSRGPIVHVAAFPLDVRDLEKRKVVLEADLIEIGQRRISFHCLSKVLTSQIKPTQYRCILECVRTSVYRVVRRLGLAETVRQALRDSQRPSSRDCTI